MISLQRGENTWIRKETLTIMNAHCPCIAMACMLISKDSECRIKDLCGECKYRYYQIRRTLKQVYLRGEEKAQEELL